MKLRAPPNQTSIFPASACSVATTGRAPGTGDLPGRELFPLAAPGQNFGVTARGLSIRTGDPRGEEFPFFRKMWIEKPSRAANALTIRALLDSESVTGAYRFTIHPSDATIIDIECSLFPRAGSTISGSGP